MLNGSISANPGAIVVIAAKPNPVDQAEKIPNIIPTPGTNIGNDADMLFRKIPKPSMSWVEDKNSCTNSFASSGLTSDVAPI